MKVKASLSALKQTKWMKYATRFFIGGAITVFAGVIAKKFGPTVGGLFLAFPAIFPASANVNWRSTRNKEGTSRNARRTTVARRGRLDAVVLQWEASV